MSNADDGESLTCTDDVVTDVTATEPGTGADLASSTTPLCHCGNELLADQSISRGMCERCHLASTRSAANSEGSHAR